jgi:hypothetical protein
MHIWTSRASLLDALRAAGVASSSIVAASVFTTLSATAEMEKIRDQIKASMIEPADFHAGKDGSRTVFSLAGIQSITMARQVGTQPSFQTQSVLLANTEPGEPALAGGTGLRLQRKHSVAKSVADH